MERKGLKLNVNAILQRRLYNGEVLEEIRLHNIVVNNGLERTARLLCGDSSTPFSNIAIGEGTTAETASDSALESEVVNESATCAYETDYKATFEKTFTFGSGESYAITEAGVFDNSTTMLDRFTFSALNVDQDVDLYIKVTVTVSRTS